MKGYRTLWMLAMALYFAVPLWAGNGVNSPYTRYGFGQLSHMETGFNKAMGGVGVGIWKNNRINLLNPASYASVDSLTFLMDIGMSLQNTNFAENGVKLNARNTTFDYFVVQFRLMPKLGFTLGYMPFSNIGYDRSYSEVINQEDENIVTNRYYGDGGLHRVVAGLGWNFMKGLSIGADISYIYGDLYHYVYNQYSDTQTGTRTKQYVAELSTFKLDLGVQYHHVLGKHGVTLGVTYGGGTTFDDKAYVIDVMGSSAAIDTVSTYRFRIPMSFGAGVSYCYDERLTIAADYTVQQYGQSDFFGMPGADMYRAMIGVEYRPQRLDRNIFRRSFYRAGVYCNTSHFLMGDAKNGYHNGPKEYGMSLGIGLPITNGWNNRSVVNVSGQLVRVEPPLPGLVAETSLRLNIGVSFNEKWFDKWRVD